MRSIQTSVQSVKDTTRIRHVSLYADHQLYRYGSEHVETEEELLEKFVIIQGISVSLSKHFKTKPSQWLGFCYVLISIISELDLCHSDNQAYTVSIPDSA